MIKSPTHLPLQRISGKLHGEWRGRSTIKCSSLALFLASSTTSIYKHELHDQRYDQDASKPVPQTYPKHDGLWPFLTPGQHRKQQKVLGKNSSF